MDDDSFLLYFPSISTMFQSSKNRTWREGTVATWNAIFRFLYDNKLLLVNPFDEQGCLKHDYKVMPSHLTEEGREMFNDAIPRWLRARDRDGNTKNLGLLEKGLKKIREKKA
jgi:hypothetical protein